MCDKIEKNQRGLKMKKSYIIKFLMMILVLLLVFTVYTPLGLCEPTDGDTETTDGDTDRDN